MDFATPPRGGKEALISAAEKKSMLDNLDLEVNDRTKSFRSHLDDLLTSFEIRQESAIMCIPKNLRNLSMKEMNELWGGDWSTTLRKLAEKTLENQNRMEKDKFDDAVQQVVDDKRKRWATGSVNSVGATGCTNAHLLHYESSENEGRRRARTQTATTAVEKSATLASLASKGKRILSGKKTKTVSTTPAVKRSTRGDSILVQSRPVLTPSSSSSLNTRTRSAVPSSAKFEPPAVIMTPKEPRTMKENEFILSANGSPVTNPWKGTPHAVSEQEHSYQMPGQYDVGASTDEDDENELPDVEEMERRLLAKSGRGNTTAGASSGKSGSLSRGKRMSTIRIRQSLSQSTLGPQRSTDPADPFALPSIHQTPRPLYPNHLFKSTNFGESSPGMSNRGAMIRVTTDAGLTIDFDPLSDDPTRVQDELIRNGVDESTRLQVRQEMAKRIRELQERLASWKI
ncbi:hypothetical protein QFC24_004216 [Naganishia onofrii]|uniref:Uncharacterized protein n=1 Tax=Naganishia onofrii TaxID=1851511 RepID=A0ACC2XFG3_9TREE|nr:hypothetical protein QFC24_004216 [Naganishia onofrii]